MNANHCDFTPNIRQAAAVLGREPTADQVWHLNLELQTLAVVDPETRTISMPADDGTVVDILSYLDRAASQFARLPEPAPAGSDQSDGMVRFQIGNSVSVRRADDAMVAITQRFQAAEAARIAAEASAWPNPFRKGQENRTRQQVLLNTNPAQAAKFKAEAGV